MRNYSKAQVLLCQQGNNELWGETIDPTDACYWKGYTSEQYQSRNLLPGLFDIEFDRFNESTEPIQFKTAMQLDKTILKYCHSCFDNGFVLNKQACKQ